MIGTVYDYYLTTYAGSTDLRKNSVHKKSELRDVYNNIVKISRKSPLYKIDMDTDVQKYAIDLKEGAYALKDVADSLNTDSLLSFSKKKATSSDSDSVSATYIGNDNNADSSAEFDITVSQLATPQINTGKYLSKNGLSIPRGNYSFDIDINEYSYELQFKVTDSETNKSLQDKLCRLINRSDIGIKASTIENPSGNSALQLTSDNTGQTFKSQIFSLKNNEDNLGDIVDYLGLNSMTTEPRNAIFSLNGVDKFSSSNTFTINKAFEVTLNNITDSDIHVGFKPDIDALIDSLKDLSSNYNSVVDIATNNADKEGDSSRLFKELQKISKRHKSSLEAAGLTFDDKGKLSVDESLVNQSVSDGSIKDSLQKIGKFKNDLTNQASHITINPMYYVDKTMISYPNPVVSFANPYVTSIYSGMMFNGYI